MLAVFGGILLIALGVLELGLLGLGFTALGAASFVPWAISELIKVF